MLLTMEGRARRGSCGNAFPEGCPALSQEHTQVLLQEPCVSAPAALPSQGSKSLCRAQPCCCCECGDSLPGETTGTVPSPRQEQDLPLSATSSHCFLGLCCSPMTWVTNPKIFRRNQVKTPLKLLSGAWLHASTGSRSCSISQQ